MQEIYVIDLEMGVGCTLTTGRYRLRRVLYARRSPTKCLRQSYEEQKTKTIK